jgi:hypothetical protein
MARLVVVLFLLGPASVVGVHPPNCPPTKSPAPTETAAPSPSPSPVPTDTQKPSTSLYPSVSPTEYPTTSEPSPTPTEVPTESPAPSPSPSEAPTKSPTAAPTVSVAPTISQAPTSTPKPSPEPTAHPSGVPSVTPTASGMPSHVPSLLPSVSPSTLPTMAPTISNAPSVSAIPSSNPSEAPSPMPSAKPSDMPSPSPTVSSAPSEIPSVMPSPQPSPKPSAFPSDQPTSMPSNLPSLQPTRMPSSVPSTEPTDVPTVSSAPSMQPSVSHMPSMSIAPSTTPSSNPTAGTRIFKSEKIHITMYELSTIMDANVQEIFERTTVTFINSNLNTRQKPTVTIEEVEVTAQLLSWERRRLQVSGEGFYDLRITFTVTASVWRGDPENFDFSSLMRDSFTEIDVLGLRKILDEISSFFGEFSPGGSQGGMARGQGSISTDVSRGFPIPVIGAVAGVLLSIAGSAMVFYLWRGARSDESISDDSRDFDLEAPVYSSGSSDDGGDHIMVKHISFDASESSMPLGARRLEHDTNVYPVKSIETSLMPAYGACHFAQNLLRFETNIEVPETPRPETPSPPFDLPRFDEDDVKVPVSSFPATISQPSFGRQPRSQSFPFFFNLLVFDVRHAETRCRPEEALSGVEWHRCQKSSQGSCSGKRGERKPAEQPLPTIYSDG